MKLPVAVFALISIAIGLAVHLVVLRWAERAWPAVARPPWVKSLRGLCVVLAVLPFSSRYVMMKTHLSVFDALMSASLVETTFVVVAAVPLLVISVLTDWRRARSEAREAESPASDDESRDGGRVAMGRRGALEMMGGGAVLGCSGLAVGWGATVGRHDYRIFEVPVRIAGLPRALDGYVITQISDLHGGLFTGERELRAGSELVRSTKPDLVVATGDLVDFDARHAPQVARALADLAPRDGVFAILGNHDYYAGVDEVSAVVRAAGVTLLVNQGRTIRASDGGGFALLGLDDLWSHRYGGPGPRLPRALADVASDIPRVLLSHQPDTFERYAGRVALQLSGHTHGGQIRPANLFLPWVAGRYERAGSTLYVNRGFGIAGPPVRLGVPPEITKIILVAA